MEGQEFLVPKEGLLIRDPKTKKFLPKAGAMKFTTGPLGRYWRRRISDGSVIVGSREVKSLQPSFSEPDIALKIRKKQNRED